MLVDWDLVAYLGTSYFKIDMCKSETLHSY